MKDGILILNKPQDWTSHDCVAVCRNVTGVRKVGHGGTLDPMAEGLLPIFFGKATKIMEYLDFDHKTYRCTVKLGVTTDTRDIWGKVIRTADTSGITEEDIRSRMEMFRGDIEQLPPKYSAVRVKGKRLYEYARDGEEVEIRPRKVKIDSIDIIDTDLENSTVSFEVRCSKGTYIRSICHDLGEALGCGGTMKALCRTGSGIFTLEDSITIDELRNSDISSIEEHMIDLDEPLQHLGIIEVKPERTRYFCNGNTTRWNQIQVLRKPVSENRDRYNSRGRNYDSIYSVYEEDTRRFLGIGYYSEEENALKADKIFTVV